MVWAAYSHDGTVSLEFVTSRMNSLDYQDVLQNNLLPYLHANPQMTFQHDNAPIHSSNSTRLWLQSNNVNTMPWPACSPDLNPIENLWGILVREVYKSGKQFSTVQELKNAILIAWRTLNPIVLKNLSLSMNSRLFQLISRNGRATDY